MKTRHPVLCVRGSAVLFFAGLGALLNGASADRLPDPAAAVGSGAWTVLFDGSPGQLERFHLYNLPGLVPERWSAAAGVLKLASRAESVGKRGKEDLVITSGAYGDFELELEWKASAGANGGIFYRVVEDPRHGKPWDTGLEYQLLDNESHKEGRVDTHRAGDLYDLIAADPVTVRPAMTWNHTRIVVRGSRLEHWLNGVKVVSADTASTEWRALVKRSKYSSLRNFAQVVPGQVVLQDHGDGLWFRNIRIREL